MLKLSREFRQQPIRTIIAASIICEYAEMIVQTAAKAATDSIIIVVVQDDLTFGGVWALPRDQLTIQLLSLEDESGWSLTFAPQATISEVTERCIGLAQKAFQRWETLQRMAM